MVHLHILDENNLESEQTKKPYLEFLVSPIDDAPVKMNRVNLAILDSIATRIGSIAPNLSAIVGISVAAKLVAEAGGLHALSKVPSRVVRIRVGFLEETEISRGTPQFLKKFVSGLLAKRSIWAAIADANSFSPSGELGRDLRAGILKEIDKRQRPKLKKPKPHNVVPNRPRRKPRGEHGEKKGEENSDVLELGQMMNQMSFEDPKPSKLGPKADSKFKRQEVGASTTQALAIVASQLESGTDLSEIAAFANLRI